MMKRNTHRVLALLLVALLVLSGFPINSLAVERTEVSRINTDALLVELESESEDLEAVSTSELVDGSQNIFAVPHHVTRYDWRDEELAVLRHTLDTPIGMQGFESDWDNDPNEIVEIAVQFVTPPAVALRLLHEEAHPRARLAKHVFEAQALAAHDAFLEQLQPLTRVRTATTEIFSEHHSLFNGVFMRVPQYMVERIAELPEVFSVTPNMRFSVDLPEARSEAASADFMRESLEFFDMDYIHNTMGFTGQGVRVAVLDTGVDYNHPRLQRYRNPATSRIRGRNFTTDNPNDIMDRDGHGTHVSGTVIAMAPDVELWHYKVLGDDGWGYNDWVISGIEAAHADRMNVMNLSLGGWSRNVFNPVDFAVNLAVLDGVVVAIAAGNAGFFGHEGLFSVMSPGSASLSISVANGRFDNKMNASSLYGPTIHTYHIKPDIVAPGTNIVSAVPGGGYESWDGTSMAAPHVAGIAALMLDMRPNAAPYEVKARIMNTANTLPNEPPVGDVWPGFGNQDILPDTWNSVFITGAGFVHPIRALQSDAFATVSHNIPWQENGSPALREETMASLSFGGVFGRAESDPLTVTIHSPGSGSWVHEVRLNGNHEGVSLNLIASNTSGTSHTYTFKMQFDDTVTDGLYEGELTFIDSNQAIALPFAARLYRDVGDHIAMYVVPPNDSLDFGVSSFARSVIIRNLGDQPTGEITVAISGADKGSFRFADGDYALPEGYSNRTMFSFRMPNINPGVMIEFIVLPRHFLDIGTYTATLSVSGGNIPTQFLDMRFEVRESTPSTGVVISPAEHDFGTAVVGYPIQHWFGKNMDRYGRAGHLSVTLEGQNPDAFNLEPSSIWHSGGGINHRNGIWVRPRTGLAPGTYEATITVTGDYQFGTSTVRFVVVETDTSSIALHPHTNHNFGTTMLNFDNHRPHWVQVRNTGNLPTGSLTVALSGENPDSFRVSNPSIASLNSGARSSFSIAPMPGIAAGTHRAIVTVSSETGISESFNISVTVTPVPQTPQLGRIRDIFPDLALAQVIADVLGGGRTIDSVVRQVDLDMISHIDAAHSDIMSLQGMQYLANLQWLGLTWNHFSDIFPLSELTNLQVLLLWSNPQISDLSPLSGLVNLHTLALGTARDRPQWEIRDFTPFSGLINLRWLDLGGNRISNLTPLSGLTNLQELFLWDNQISDLIPLSGLANLRYLDLSNNHISALTPLSGLSNLWYLDLRNNHISALTPLSGLTDLRTLFLDNNHISNPTPLSGLSNLRSLTLDDQQVIQKPTAWTNPLVVPNIVRDASGNSIAPHDISGNGTYRDGNITWTNFDVRQSSVTYSWGQTTPIGGNDWVWFNGTVTAVAPFVVEEIELFPTGTHTFPQRAIGYTVDWGALARHAYIQNTSRYLPTGPLTVSLVGEHADSFNLYSYRGSPFGHRLTISNIAQGDTEHFIVRPASGLNAGTYTATVMVSGANIEPQTFAVTFTVTARPTDDPPVEAEREFHPAYMFGVRRDGVLHFDPTANITRAQVAAILARTMIDEFDSSVHSDDYELPEGMDSFDEFSDVGPNNWFYHYVAWAYQEGLVQGIGGGRFAPNALITREQLAAMLVRTLDVEYRETAVGPTMDFPDAGTISSWAPVYVYNAFRQGWMIGDARGDFRPGANIFRAEVATAVNRILERIDHNDERTRLGAVLENEYRAATFPDVAVGNWFFASVLGAANDHYLTRDEDGAIDWKYIIRPQSAS
ncbi:MAG: S8 family serine peptidase [Oscillospiraceae bacterium]|nr:S8 family serine peptidase [Oscillospiraceae bacterium]